MLKRLLLIPVFALWSVAAIAQWQVPINTIPVGRGAGVTGFNTVGGSAGTGAKCLLDSAPPAFGTCPGGLIVGTSTITGGSSGDILIKSGGVLGVITPAAGIATWIGAPSSANLRAALTDESGTGAALFQNGDLGTPTAGVATNLTGTAASLIAGTATNAVNSGITDDASTNATMFPTWVTIASGNRPLKVSSTLLYWNPSFPRLTISRGPTWVAAGTTSLHIIGNNTAGEGRIEITAANADSVLVLSRANGALSATTALLSGDQIGGIIGTGIDTATSITMQQGPSFGIYAYENWNSTSHGSGFQLFGIKNTTTTIVNFMTLREQRAGFGTESNPQYTLTASKNATAGITDPFGNDGLGLIGVDGGSVVASLQTFGANNPSVTMYRAGGTSAAKTALASGAVIAQFQAFGYAGATSLYNGGAGFQIIANENLAVGAAGTRLELTATPNGSLTQAAAVTVYGSKGMFVGASAADPGSGVINAAVALQTVATTVGSLGTCNAAAKGQRKFVTDSNAASYTAGIGAVVAAGGTTNVPTSCDGTSWRIGANDNLPHQTRKYA